MPSRTPARTARRLAVAAGCAALISAALVTPGRAAEPLDYVALGDSFAAAPLVPAPDLAHPLCLASRSGYPDVAAERLGAELDDVSCSGAKVGDLAGRQFGVVAPQYEALGADTDLVSLTVGGNDTNLVAAALGCVNLAPEPLGSSCADRYTKGGGDQLGEAVAAWAPQLGAALDEIHRRAPRARVFVVGYGDYIRQGGCWPTQPIWARDGDYLQRSVDKLSAALRDQAAAHGASFVDAYAATRGHDACAAPGDRHLEGLVPSAPAAPLHPNGAGSKAVGEALARAVRG
ncbi:SGNH/GDSL hydrolase family protein [Streptomyces physcomitrii]|uniref:SGNH/GDSL hydrolase family protein n=1 Tax=Streptomyces physcomitrii TaxID=2724184 RepID=A0ABX1GVS2_9ACTN|nr:SGNH/GDSL hydrolase family protein [Streptomyces physcomitrii]NKI40157.1 SGNH/GDSL hydrolase family protein [Streptomyces physcomitrii]